MTSWIYELKDPLDLSKEQVETLLSKVTDFDTWMHLMTYRVAHVIRENRYESIDKINRMFDFLRRHAEPFYRINEERPEPTPETKHIIDCLESNIMILNRAADASISEEHTQGIKGTDAQRVLKLLRDKYIGITPQPTFSGNHPFTTMEELETTLHIPDEDLTELIHRMFRYRMLYRGDRYEGEEKIFLSYQGRAMLEALMIEDLLAVS